MPPDTNEVRGVPLLQFAAVNAAREAGFELQQVLEVEGLEASLWRSADVGFKLWLTRDRTLLGTYQDTLGRERRRLGRRIDPLSDDLEPWLRFLACYRQHAAPFELLAALRMTLADVAVLQEGWTARFIADKDLRERAERLAARAGVARAAPTVRIRAAVLGPSAAARRQWTACPSDYLGEPEVMSIRRQAELAAELRIWPKRRAEIARRYGLAVSELAERDRALMQRLERHPQEAADYRALTAHFERTMRARPPAPARSATVPSPPRTADLNATACLADGAALSASALPFRAVASAPSAVSVPLAAGPTPNPSAVTPPAGSPPTPIDVAAPQFTVAQYASLRAELAYWPKEKLAVLHRYRLSDEKAFFVVRMTWMDRLRAGPELQAEYDHLYARYSAWLKSGGASTIEATLATSAA
jgi:hypothetical protein